MPYITKTKKEDIYAALRGIIDYFQANGVTSGDLNYTITELAHFYVKNKGINYTYLNDVMGVLESSKVEFYRRVVSKYEDRKISENGDVYDEEY